MRESKTFGTRSVASKSKEALKKYILVFEGYKTEPIYFKEVNALREQIGISSLVEIVYELGSNIGILISNMRKQ